ncbi:sulfatase-like hydrolase/transferase [Haloferula sp. A504]|uniref:sulfatase-like hydrolase/transferase n=1 Tax=Haloferula sp. A504 TaxID=3373601 RepID=UPI0031C0C830|nr:sulfatase-like hydrolase/transferase [Verrucomicrobiaceae bacterium E54]
MHPQNTAHLALLLLVFSAASASATVVWEEKFASEPTWAADSISPGVTEDVTATGTKFIRGGGRVDHRTSAGSDGAAGVMRLRPSDNPDGETRGFSILLDSTILTPGSYTLSYYLSTNASAEPEDYVHASVWEADSSGGSGSYTINVMPGVSALPTVDAGTATPALLGSKQTTLPDNTDFTLQSFDFNYTGGDVILLFATIEGNAGGDGQDVYFLDNVQITASDPPPSSSQPNIIFLFADDAGYQDFGFQDPLTGQTTEFLTPNLDQLAQQSILCSAAYVSSSVCSPSRAGLLSGRMQNRFGYEGNVANANDPNDGMPLDEKLIFERLGELGYEIGVVGKWHIGRHLTKQPKQRGVDYFYGMWGGSRQYFGTESSDDKRLRDNDGNWRSNWVNEPSFNGIAPDPTHGRHLTDAFGDAACEFIHANANTGQPFFLYLPFTTPHGPYDLSKAEDLALFSGFTDWTANHRNSAALVHAMDRAIGYILDRLEDPNNDGDTADSIAGNTIVVFTNDNGGPTNKDEAHRNFPLHGDKGSPYEGGHRVPFIVRIPDPANPGQYHVGTYAHAISTLDMYPTFVEAAGGTVEKQTDGVNLLPYLTGENTSPPHERLVWRRKPDWAILEGEWKLSGTSSGNRLNRINANGSGEPDDLSATYPEIRQDLLEKFVAYEVQFDKERWTDASSNRFDDFRFRESVATNQNFSTANAWTDGSSNKTMVTNDVYPNLSLEFRPRNDADYTANNDLDRLTALGFMLNEIVFAGSFGGTADRTATVTGNPMMFVNDQTGTPPGLRLDATSTSSSSYSFEIANDLILYNDFEITGESPLDYLVSGDISVFANPCSLTKSGAARVKLAGANAWGGTTRIQGGTLALASGMQTRSLEMMAGATLEMNLDNTITVDGTAALQGHLKVLPGTANSPTLIQATSISGRFTTTSLPAPPSGEHWQLVYTATSVELTTGAFPDTDGDLLDDNWEISQFGNLTASRGGNDNFDGDPDSDLMELITGTAANDPSSFFRTTVSAPAPSTLRIDFDGRTGRSYVIETSESLDGGDWTERSSIGPLGADGPQSLQYAAPGSPPALFGRIRISSDTGP